MLHLRQPRLEGRKLSRDLRGMLMVEAFRMPATEGVAPARGIRADGHIAARLPFAEVIRHPRGGTEEGTAHDGLGLPATLCFRSVSACVSR